MERSKPCTVLASIMCRDFFESRRGRGGRHRGAGRRYEDRDERRFDDQRNRRRDRSRSPGQRRGHSPAREGSAERRARIEQWNREREEHQAVETVSPGPVPRDATDNPEE